MSLYFGCRQSRTNRTLSFTMPPTPYWPEKWSTLFAKCLRSTSAGGHGQCSSRYPSICVQAMLVEDVIHPPIHACSPWVWEFSERVRVCDFSWAWCLEVSVIQQHDHPSNTRSNWCRHRIFYIATYAWRYMAKPGLRVRNRSKLIWSLFLRKNHFL